MIATHLQGGRPEKSGLLFLKLLNFRSSTVESRFAYETMKAFREPSFALGASDFAPHRGRIRRGRTGPTQAGQEGGMVEGRREERGGK